MSTGWASQDEKHPARAWAEVPAAERTLWALLSGGALASAKFARRVQIGAYVADFASGEHRLVVELEEPGHALQETHDRTRDALLLDEGYAVLRFSRDEVDASPDGVATMIALEIERRTAAPDLRTTEAAPPVPAPAGAGRRADARRDPATDTSGHRRRLRGRLLDGGGDALLDHELVEYLLGLSIRRGDTKPLARRLLAEFGSYGALVTAERESLFRAGLGETSVAVLKIAQASALRMLAHAVEGRPVLASWQALSDYLHASMAHRMNEAARVLHLNTKNMLIRDETMNEGSIDQAAIHVREVVRRALDLGSAAIILVHNHPSGDPAPSRQDIAITREIAAALKPLGIALHDHIIVGSQGQASLRSMGLI